MRIIDRIVDLLFPRRCAVCDEPMLPGDVYICPKCKKKIVYVEEPFCLKCGKPLPDNREFCNDCISRHHYFESGSAVFDYGSISDSLFRFKNKGRVEYARFYASELYKKKKEWLDSIKPDAFIPVPIHKSKRRTRGYNQSEIISRELSAISSIPTITDLVIRSKKTSPLKNMGLSERQNHIKGAFKVKSNVVKLSTIVIIDDIYTTGSTIDAIAAVILEHFDCKIYFLTVTIGRGV